jgi:hypothetical protein
MAKMNQLFITSQNFAADKTVYSKALNEKGKANGGTDIGFYVATFNQYTNVFVKSFDVYNSCKLDYYMTSLG